MKWYFAINDHYLNTIVCCLLSFLTSESCTFSCWRTNHMDNGQLLRVSFNLWLRNWNGDLELDFWKVINNNVWISCDRNLIFRKQNTPWEANCNIKSRWPFLLSKNYWKSNYNMSIAHVWMYVITMYVCILKYRELKQRTMCGKVDKIFKSSYIEVVVLVDLTETYVAIVV